MTPDDCAVAIEQALAAPPEPTAFARLAAM